jgi:hypothetical protein
MLGSTVGRTLEGRGEAGFLVGATEGVDGLIVDGRRVGVREGMLLETALIEAMKKATASRYMGIAVT